MLGFNVFDPDEVVPEDPGPQGVAIVCIYPCGIRDEARQKNGVTPPPVMTLAEAWSNVLRELKKIKLAWTGLNYSTAPGVLILHPSAPAIAPAQQLQLVE